MHNFTVSKGKWRCTDNLKTFTDSLRQKKSTEGYSKLKKSGNKTSSGENALDIKTHVSPKVGQDQVSWGVSVPCWHATPGADALWKPVFGEISNSVIMLIPVRMSQTSIISIRYRMSLVSTRRTNASPKRGTGPGVRSSKRPLLACGTRYICSMETLYD